MLKPRTRQPRTAQSQTLRLADNHPAAGTTILFATDPIATARRIARLLEPELKVRPGWDHQGREAVWIGPPDQRTYGPAGLFLADGEQLVIGNDGAITVEVRHAR